MKYRLKCNVIGRVTIGKEIKTEKAPYEYILNSNKDGLLESISITTTVSNPEKCYSSVGPGIGLSKATITLGGDKETHDRIIKEFQSLESLLSFATAGSLKRIEWESPKTEFIPENEIESANVSVPAYEFKLEYPSKAFALKHEIFQKLINTKEMNSSLNILKAFYREGINEFEQFKYINAFYNFYYILEDLYFDSRLHKDVLTAFSKSDELKHSIDKILNRHIVDGSKHCVALQDLCKYFRKKYDADGLVRLLVTVRNNLHHYSNRNIKRFWNPYKQRDFESIAYLALALAVFGIANMENKILG